jgi:hypothetical protein
MIQENIQAAEKRIYSNKRIKKRKGKSSHFKHTLSRP